MNKVVTDATGVGAYLKGDTGTLAINDSQFNDSGYAGLYVSEQDGNTYLNDVQANGNETSTHTSLEDLLKTGGAFIDSDTGKVVIRGSDFGNNTGAGLVVHATGGDLFLKDVTANGNTGTGAVLNTLFALDNLQTENGTGKIIITGDLLDATAQITGGGDAFTSQFNGNGGPGLMAYAGGFAGVFNTEVSDNLNKTNNFLVDIALGLGGIPPLESVLLNPGGAFVYSASPDTVVVGNSDFIGNNGEGLAVMTPGDIRVHDVIGSNNDGMGAFLDNCLLGLSLQCSGEGTISVVNGEFDVNSYAGLVALASGAQVSTEDVGNSFYQGIYLDQVGASGNQNYGALLVSPADVEVTNSTFNGQADVSDTVVSAPYQQGLGLGVLSSGNVILASYEDLFGPVTIGGGDDFGVYAGGNAKAGGEILGLGSLGGLGSGSLFSSVIGDDTPMSGMVLVGDSKFVKNGGDGLTVLATTGIGISDSIFAGNGGNGLTALSLGDIYLNDSGFFRNQGTGATAISVLGNIWVDPSIFAGNGGNGLTALALVSDIFLEDSASTATAGMALQSSQSLNGVCVEDGLFAGNEGIMA